MRKRDKIHHFGLLHNGTWIRWNKDQIKKHAQFGNRHNVECVVAAKSMSEADLNYFSEEEE